MKLKYIVFFSYLMLCSSFFFAQTENKHLPDPNNPDCIYEKTKLGKCFIHMAKITTPSKGSAPAVEVLFAADFQWEACEPDDGWGRKDKTYRYCEHEVPGSTVFFNVTNKLDDVTYYRVEGLHPFNLPHKGSFINIEVFTPAKFFKALYADWQFPCNVHAVIIVRLSLFSNLANEGTKAL